MEGPGEGVAGHGFVEEGGVACYHDDGWFRSFFVFDVVFLFFRFFFVSGGGGGKGERKGKWSVLDEIKQEKVMVFYFFFCFCFCFYISLYTKQPTYLVRISPFSKTITPPTILLQLPSL